MLTLLPRPVNFLTQDVGSSALVGGIRDQGSGGRGQGSGIGDQRRGISTEYPVLSTRYSVLIPDLRGSHDKAREVQQDEAKVAALIKINVGPTGPTINGAKAALHVVSGEHVEAQAQLNEQLVQHADGVQDDRARAIARGERQIQLGL